MKTFIGALITLGLLAGIVLCNGIFIAHRTDELLEACDRLPHMLEGYQESLPTGYAPDTLPFMEANQSIHLKWDACRFLICLSVSHAEAELIDEALTELANRYSAGDNAGYVVARGSLIDEISELKKSESFSLEGIM